MKKATISNNWIIAVTCWSCLACAACPTLGVLAGLNGLQILNS